LVAALAAVQLAYAIYMAQVPDWSSMWVAAQASLCVAAIYATGLGIALFAGPGSAILNALELADRQPSGQMQWWCLIVFSLSLLLSYLLGRTSLRWYRISRLVATLPQHN
jgi:hypothetical protein